MQTHSVFWKLTVGVRLHDIKHRFVIFIFIFKKAAKKSYYVHASETFFCGWWMMVAPPACRETVHDKNQMHAADSVWPSSYNKNNNIINTVGGITVELLCFKGWEYFVFHEESFLKLPVSASELLWLMSEKGGRAKARKKNKTQKTCTLTFLWKLFTSPQRWGSPVWSHLENSQGRSVKNLPKPQASFPLVSVPKIFLQLGRVKRRYDKGLILYSIKLKKNKNKKLS